MGLFPANDLQNVNKKLHELELQESYGIYNRHVLKKIGSTTPLKINILGDSITSGTGADLNYGYAQQFETALNMEQNGRNYEQGFFYYNTGSDTWATENSGINLFLMSSTNDSSSLLLDDTTAKIPTEAYKVAIVYSRRTDGGTFEIRESATDTLLDTISCSGSSADGLITDYYTVTASNTIKIVPLSDNKAYINGWIRVLDNTKDSYQVNIFSQGGRKAVDYTDTDLINTVKFGNPQLVIWALGTNDFTSSIEISKQKALTAINAAKEIGADVLLLTVCSSSYSESTYRELWAEPMIKMAYDNKCALIDYDLLFGGYTQGNSNGLFADTVHPSPKGHMLMANHLLQLVKGIDNPYLYGNRLNVGDNRYIYYNANENVSNEYHTGNQIHENLFSMVFNRNGYKEFKRNMPIINITNESQLPKYAPNGLIASWYNSIYLNTVDWGTNKDTNANWKELIAIPRLKTVSSLPSGANPGLMYRLHVDGVEDSIVTQIQKSNGTYKWVKVAVTDYTS